MINKIANQSKRYAIKLANELNYVGTMCVEYFIDENNDLFVNEIAPRVHNSGHLTINAYNISQFESHIRSVCNLEAIEPVMKSAAIMQNIIGNDIFKYKNKEYKSNEFFFDYLKKEAKPKRKMGHLTTTLEDLKPSGFCTFFFIKNTRFFKQRQKFCFNFIKFTYF